MPTTLTTARDDVTRAVANLRALGCKVRLYLTREQGYSISIDPEPAKVTIELTPEQVGGLRDLVNEYDNGGVSLELAEMLAESVREILP